MTPTPTTASWEEEFDSTVGSYTNEYSYVHKIPNSEEIKTFIRSLLKENTTATLREVMEEIKKVKDRGYNHGYSVTKHIEDFIQHKLTSE